jgi:curli biogenesis system outer membrane secretion channel CsgG
VDVAPSHLFVTKDSLTMSTPHFSKTGLPMLLAALTLSACQSPIVMGDPSAKTAASGAAGGATAVGENKALEKCSEPMGTISLVENQSAGWYGILTGQYKLPPTANLLRLMIQQSNCFVVVERGRAGMQAMTRERELMNSGETRAGSDFGKGQMVASDYAMTPEVNFSADNTGGIGGAIGGLLPGTAGKLLGAVGGSAKTREASVMLTVVDNRSGVQLAAAEGSASKTDFGAFGALFGGSAGASLGGYSNTPQGKVISAAFMDAYNQTVKALRNYKAQEVKGGLGKGGKLKVGQ